MMDKQTIINREIQSIHAKREMFIQKCSPVPLRAVIKKILIDMYNRGVLPKEVAQKVYNILRLKDC